ncbi:helix-turn-helix domain-containing protein [Kitasatospora sp. NPDC001527]|uniref:helix-turn-helix domain-containing protein n=1 Tax=Kitasatospora sp. NPDC001527 TaxID=3154519 RepID=UPI003326F5BB
MRREVARELGEFVRQLRRRAQLTQEQLADRSELSVRTVRRLETGTSSDTRLSTLHHLANGLGVSTEERERLTAILDSARPEPVGPLESAGRPPARPDPTDPPASPDPTDPPTGPRPPVPDPAAPHGPSNDAIADAAASLAREVRRRLLREEQHRRVHDPFPLPVRYGPAPADLMDRPENVQRLRPGDAPEDLDLNGELGNVVATYRGVTSRRLVVLGRPGSGKSVLAARFALDLLSSAPLSRVPVVLGIGAWDPDRTAPRDLLVDHLQRDHPHLASRMPDGSTLAAALVDADLVLPVLDGFDELAEDLREPALEALNSTSLPLVLTSRRDEYARAVRAVGAPLVWAACVELADLGAEDLAAYLPRTDRRAPAPGEDGGPELWDAVLERLQARDTPAGVRLGEVLGTPLMVTLARTMYARPHRQDPAELLDATAFPTPRHLEEHLLTGFVPALYRHRAAERGETEHGQRGHDPARAHRWLGHLASALDARNPGDRQDLAWWRLGESVRTPTRVLHTVLVSALCMTAALCLVESLGQAFLYTSGFDPARLLLQGALAGLLSGTTFGLAHCALAVSGRAAALPSRVRLALPTAWRPAARRPGEVRARFRAGLLGGSVLGVGYAWADILVRAMWDWLPDTGLARTATDKMLAFGLTFGLTAGLVFALIAALEVPVDTTAAATPSGLLAADRAAALGQFLLLAPAITLGCALGGSAIVALLDLALPWSFTWPLTVALPLAAIGGLGGSASYVLAFTAWGRWLTTARIWLPLTRRLPWDAMNFLDDAHRRGVLRRTGAVYQFRHQSLQQVLARPRPGADPGRRPAVEPPGRRR